MRILWITNIPVAEHRKMLGLSLNQSGGWIEASYAAVKDKENLTLGVVTTYGGKEIKREHEGHHSFFLIPCIGNRAKDVSGNSQNQHFWRIVIDEFKPDLIHLWGTEFSHGLCALKVRGNIPSVVYIQGLMKELYHHYFDGMSLKDCLLSTTLRSLIKREDYWSNRKRYKEQAKNEAAIISISKKVIVESDWCAAHCRSIAPECRVFKSLLPINSVFEQYHWTAEKMEPHTIFTTAGVNTIKGHHIFLKALAIIKTMYPDVKVYEPGENYYYDKSLRRRLMRDSYINHILKLETKLGLEGNIVRLGRLTPNQMGEYMSKCNVFVMPSVIENHSSTLIEAMMVGAPCVTSYVGGISEYLRDGENGFFYNSSEPEMLASRVIELFGDIDKCIAISTEARKNTIEARCVALDLTRDFETIYSNIAK